MKWSVYKKMSKEHKEEYQYKFGGDFWWIGQCTFAVGCLLAQTTAMRIIMGGASLVMFAFPELAERAWLKKRGYTEEEE